MPGSPPGAGCGAWQLARCWETALLRVPYPGLTSCAEGEGRARVSPSGCALLEGGWEPALWVGLGLLAPRSPWRGWQLLKIYQSESLGACEPTRGERAVRKRHTTPPFLHQNLLGPPFHEPTEVFLVSDLSMPVPKPTAAGISQRYCRPCSGFPGASTSARTLAGPQGGRHHSPSAWAAPLPAPRSVCSPGSWSPLPLLHPQQRIAEHAGCSWPALGEQGPWGVPPHSACFSLCFCAKWGP